MTPDEEARLVSALQDELVARQRRDGEMSMPTDDELRAMCITALYAAFFAQDTARAMYRDMHAVLDDLVKTIRVNISTAN